MESINPATGEKLQSFQAQSYEDALGFLERAVTKQATWAQRSVQDRLPAFEILAKKLRDEKQSLAQVMTKEMGKPIVQAEGEIEKCARMVDFYVQTAPKVLANESIKTEASQSFVRFDALGVLLGVMPWNFPFWQVLRFAVPSLLSGNAVLLKHAPNVSGCAHEIERLFIESRLPEDLYQALFLEVPELSELIAHPSIRGVSLTGSTIAGRSVGRISGESLKRSVLELGGSDPYLVFEDAELKNAVNSCLKGRMINSGQSCVAAKRLLVHEKVYIEFCDRLLLKMQQLKQGDPFDRETEIGPIAREDLRDQLHDQVKRTIAAGAKCLLGGEIPDGPGFFYPPSLLVDVDESMPAFQEELFGPVAAVGRFKEFDEAIAKANASPFGLGAAVFTEDTQTAKKAIAMLEVGNVFINDFVHSDPRLPFGGVKDSGFGRELGTFALREFVNIKTVSVK